MQPFFKQMVCLYDMTNNSKLIHAAAIALLAVKVWYFFFNFAFFTDPVLV